MSENILVSVIVPVYNSKKFLEACLDSIVNQSYKNLEILLIDDGSNDGSADILDLYSTKDDRIRVIHNLNYGVSYSRNYGLKIASGSKVLFIDSDDTVNLDYVNKLIESLKKEDKDLVICGINDPIISILYSRMVKKRNKKLLQKNRRKDLQKYGMDILRMVDSALITNHINYFVDFGTLLGLVREKGFIKHDLDMDFGILETDSFSWDKLECLMTANKMKKIRQFVYKGIITEIMCLFSYEKSAVSDQL